MGYRWYKGRFISDDEYEDEIVENIFVGITIFCAFIGGALGAYIDDITDIGFVVIIVGMIAGGIVGWRFRQFISIIIAILIFVAIIFLIVYFIIV